MQSPSEAFDEAIESGEVRLRPVLRADWARDGYDSDLDDLSEAFASLTLERSLSGDLPDAAVIVEGEASAKLDADLVGGYDEDSEEDTERARDAAWLYSRLNTASPLASYDRRHMPVQYRMGALTSQGWQYVDRLTGLATGLDVEVPDGSAQLAALDYRERVSRPVTLPAVVADEGDGRRLPGLNAQWPMDYALRANGVHTVPPVRESCALSVTFHGSCYPEVGTLDEARVVEDGDARQPTFSQGAFALALDPVDFVDFANGQFITIDLDPSCVLSTNDGATIFGQCWVRLTTTSTGRIWHLPPNIADGPEVIVRVDGGDISLWVKRASGGGWDTIWGPSVTPLADDEWLYLGVKIEFTAADINVVFRYGGQEQSVSWLTVSVDGEPQFQSGITWGEVPIEAWQLTCEGPDAEWDADFEPTAVLEPSVNELTAIIDVDAQDSWELIKDISGAEFGVVHFDEQGIFRFWSREHWASEAAQTEVRTLDIADQIKAIGYVDGVDQCYNRVEVPVSPVAVGGLEDVWTSSTGRIRVGQFETIVVDAELSGPVADLRTWWTPFEHADYSWFEARADPTGAGPTDVTSVTIRTVSAVGRVVRLAITNSSNQVLWLVDSTGNSAVHMRGRPITVSSDSTTRPSAEMDGPVERTLSLQANPWRQSEAMALGVAQSLVGQLANPRPTITRVSVPGDPRLQLGDRVRLVAAPIGLDAAYNITAIRESVSDSGYEMDLSFREALSLLIWDVGQWDVHAWG